MHWFIFPFLFQLILGMAFCFLFNWHRQLELRSQVPTVSGRLSSFLSLVAKLAAEYFFFVCLFVFLFHALRGSFFGVKVSI